MKEKDGTKPTINPDQDDQKGASVGRTAWNVGLSLILKSREGEARADQDGRKEVAHARESSIGSRIWSGAK
jgi:hypothetical protein